MITNYFPCVYIACLLFSVGNIPDYSDLFGEISDDDEDDDVDDDGIDSTDNDVSIDSGISDSDDEEVDMEETSSDSDSDSLDSDSSSDSDSSDSDTGKSLLMSRDMWFPTMWHFDKCKLIRACVASFEA